MAQATGECLAVWRAAIDPKTTADWQIRKGIELDPLLHGVSKLRERFSAALLILAGAVALLLLMVCANVDCCWRGRRAGGRKSRFDWRWVRRARLDPRDAVETLVLSLAGGAAGLGLAYALAPLLERALPPVRDMAAVSLPLALHLSPDLRVFVFGSACGRDCGARRIVAVAVGLARGSGFAASLVTIQRVVGVMRAPRSGGVEVALCTLLLTGAGL